MLGINLVFAGFALSLNGLSYLIEVDEKVKGMTNVLVGIVIGINAIFQTAQATDHVNFGFAAAMWLFALNYLVIATHIFFDSKNWKIFGLYGLFAAMVSMIFMAETLATSGPWELVVMWLMWAILWGQSFFAILLENKTIDRLTPHILILNGVTSTFIPGILILLGVIL
jgi:hypothetical protein